MLFIAPVSTGTRAAASFDAICHASAPPAMMMRTLASVPSLIAASMSDALSARSTSGRRRSTTGTSASRSARPAAKSRVPAFSYSARRPAYVRASSRISRSLPMTSARALRPAEPLSVCATIATGALASMSATPPSTRSMIAACPEISPPVGASTTVVMPSSRAGAINTDAGFMPSQTLNAAAMPSFPRAETSRVPVS